jgi:hypothetical protein
MPRRWNRCGQNHTEQPPCQACGAAGIPQEISAKVLSLQFADEKAANLLCRINRFLPALRRQPTFAEISNYVGGVTNPSFQLWDVDASSGTFLDTIKNLQATTTTGTTIYPTLTPTAGFNQVTGSGASAVITGTNNANNNTNQGTVGVSFTGTVTSISFQWSNGDSALLTQSIAISPITFTPVGAAFPEVGSATGALALCGGLLGAGRFRRRRSADAVAGA